MGMEFVQGYREANAPKRAAAEAEKPKARLEAPRADADTEAGDEADTDVVVTDAPRGGSPNGNGRSTGDRITIVNANAGALKPIGGGRREPDADGDGTATATATERKTALAEAMSAMQADAPACDVCGTITVRNGTCYKCMNCGNSMGCS